MIASMEEDMQVDSRSHHFDAMFSFSKTPHLQVGSGGSINWRATSLIFMVTGANARNSWVMRSSNHGNMVVPLLQRHPYT